MRFKSISFNHPPQIKINQTQLESDPIKSSSPSTHITNSVNLYDSDDENFELDLTPSQQNLLKHTHTQSSHSKHLTLQSERSQEPSSRVNLHHSSKHIPNHRIKLHKPTPHHQSSSPSEDRICLTSNSTFSESPIHIPSTLPVSTVHDSNLSPIVPHPSLSALYVPSTTLKQFKAGPKPQEPSMAIIRSRAVRRKPSRDHQHRSKHHRAQVGFERNSNRSDILDPVTSPKTLSGFERKVDLIINPKGLLTSSSTYHRMRHNLETDLLRKDEWPTSDEVAKMMMIQLF